MPDHPVRSIKGGFAASLLMSRPPLLFEEGSSVHNKSIFRRAVADAVDDEHVKRRPARFQLQAGFCQAIH